MIPKPWFAASCAPNPADPLESMVAGFFGGVISVTFVFPIHKVMFGQQVKGLSTTSSFKGYLKAGPKYYFKGVLPPVLQKGTQTAYMFGLNTLLDQKLAALKVNDQERRVLRSMSGIGSGTLDWLIFTPMERVQTLLMDMERNKDPSARSTLVTARNVIAKGGFLEIYRGGQMIITRNVISSPMYLLTMEAIRSRGKPEKMPEAVHNFLVSSISGGSFSTLFYPFNVLKSKAQLVVGGKFLPYGPIVKELLKEGGVRRLWRGAHLNFLRSSVGWGVSYPIYQYLSQRIHFYRCPDEKNK